MRDAVESLQKDPIVGCWRCGSWTVGWCGPAVSGYPECKQETNVKAKKNLQMIKVLGYLLLTEAFPHQRMSAQASETAAPFSEVFVEWILPAMKRGWRNSQCGGKMFNLQMSYFRWQWIVSSITHCSFCLRLFCLNYLEELDVSYNEIENISNEIQKLRYL